MLERRAAYVLLFLSMAWTSLLFNNCAGQLSTIESVEGLETSSQAPPPSSGSTPNLQLVARLDSISSDGKAYGYAQNSRDKAKQIKVLFYVNAPVGTGTYVGEATANGNSPGTYTGHYFSFQIPAEFANGKSQKLYVYGVSAKPENLILPSPMTFASYTPKAEAYFNQNIALTTGADCARCHGWSYRSLYFGPLINPTPFGGGTATNNRLIRKVGGLEGHGGGNFCPGGIDTGICANLQAWWHAEFD